MRDTWPARTIGSHGQRLLPWPSSQRWNSPTFGEFVDKVEHEFGKAADVAGLLLLGLERDEPLHPTDIETLCSQLGVPSEDFGLDP